ncbi:MAG TPA: tyrosine-type recombinase/integrase [Gammaproteobacteria bacterium]|nr:tyrosine-type recombinase/integrase [Micavibrio sp.]MBK9561892.1 tyrosine-type recombinase/integrase [Micavibrio sp.]HQW57656.1 tyrosine-type recombinase/integrase [Gammaproteobacteria bacterium]
MLKPVHITNAKPKDRPYKLFDGEGLYLLIKPNGGRLWYWKYYYLGKEKKLAIGPYRDISLAQAREIRSEARKLLAIGKDPSLAKQEQKRIKIREAGNTFEMIAREWLDHKEELWEAKTKQTKVRRLEMYVFPVIGHLPITDITPMTLLECIRRIESKKAYDVARRMKQTMSGVFRYAVITGRVSGDPTPALDGALKPMKRGHYAAISSRELPDFLASMNRNDHRVFLQTRLGMELLLLTFVRTSELIGSKWHEFDLDEAIWVIPAERMKTRKEHVVPLARQVVEKLRQLRELSGRSEWVLPSQCNSRKHMSNNTIRTAIVRMGYGGRMTGHGCRALAMSTIKERLGYRHEIVDRQLSHVHHNSVTRAYDRAEWIEDRTKMMQDWADYIDKVQKDGKL